MEQLAAELRNGGRFIVYRYTISLIFLSSRRSSEVFFFRARESRFAKGIPYTLCSLVFGWWGLPWGPLFTLESLATNLIGGEDVTEKVQELMKQKARAGPESKPRPAKME